MTSTFGDSTDNLEVYWIFTMCSLGQFLGWILSFAQLLFIQGYVLDMITEGQRYVVNRGESIVLNCDFTAENYYLFDYPVLWVKKQHHEHHQINIMGNLNHPFIEPNRFHVSYTPQDPQYRLRLVISDVVAEDSGNYTCEIRSPTSTVLTSVTHYVYIKSPIKSITLQAGNHTVGTNMSQLEKGKHWRRVTMREHTFNSVKCIVQGGYPAPKITMKLGKKDITRNFQVETVTELAGEPGLRLISYRTEMWSDSFVPYADNDGNKLKCFASVPGLGNNVTALKLDVHYAPEIECHSLSVPVGEMNAALRCIIWFKPELTDLIWIIDANGTTLTADDAYYGFWVLSADESDNKRESQLIISHVKPEYYGTYTIVAENSVAATTRNVDLIQETKTVTSGPPRTDAGIMSDEDHSKYVPFKGNASGKSRLFSTYWILQMCFGVYLLR